MNKHYRVYWEKLLETVAFSYGKVSLYELVQKEHKHFHPSGCTTPSTEDIQITEKLYNAGLLLDVQLLDHIIIGGTDYYSFKENNLIIQCF